MKDNIQFDFLVEHGQYEPEKQYDIKLSYEIAESQSDRLDSYIHDKYLIGYPIYRFVI